MILWKTIKLFILALCLFPRILFAFNAGEGSEFIMDSNNQKVSLSIYTAYVTKKKMGIEFHFGSGQILLSNMWQQFELDLSNGSSIRISKGYIKFSESSPPEIMEKENIEINKGVGVELQDFLFSDKKKLEKDFVASETVELPAGSIIAKHYRKKRFGQVIDFWISSDVKPIGLVKLISKNKNKKSQNYTIELSSLLKNVKAAINPKKAVPMRKESKLLLNQAAQ